MAPDRNPTETPDTRAVARVRFETRRRVLRVAETLDLSPNMRRVELRGDLEGFQSLGFDDHIKLFLPDPKTGELVLPDPAAGHGGVKALMRDYTPRRFDVAKGELTIDFALHNEGEAGPATAWARAARAGDTLHMGGPRGSQIIPDAYDFYLLIGDDTALPAIARRLEELRPEARVLVLVETAGRADRFDLPAHPNADIRWRFRDEGESLVAAVEALTLPDGDLHAWAACEAAQARAIRGLLAERHGMDPRALRVSAYWRRGATDAHEKFD